MELPPGATAWVCVRCRTRNAMEDSTCTSCGLSFAVALGDDSPAPAAPRPPAERWIEAVGQLFLVAVLFFAWRLGDAIAGRNTTGSLAHGRSIWDLERRLHLPSEASVQRQVLPHVWLVHALDVYYLAAHLGVMLVFAVWLYVRHRDRYPLWRNVIVVFTATSFLIQLIPVAPPRRLSGLGLVDTGRRYGESVYAPDSRSGFANQVSSMPSVHVGWAILIAVAVIAVSTSRWRWLAIAHPVLTTFAVVATANHYWLDAVAAAALAALVLAVLRRRTPGAT